MPAPEMSPQNSDYAQEWISFLRRRNLVLTIAWPVLLTLFIVAGFAAIYFYQSMQAVQLNLDLLSEQQQALESDKTALKARVDKLSKENEDLLGEVSALKSAREALSVQQGDSESKLNITSQMLENLEQQLAIFKNENAELLSQLNLARQSLNEIESKYQLELSTLAKKNTSTLSELNKQLSSRKTAYQALANRQQEMRDEMDRYSNMVAAKDKELAKLKDEKSALNTQLKETKKNLQIRQAEFNALQKNYNDLDTKLKALVSPIGSGKTSAASGKNAQTPSSGAENKYENVTGFEEIKKPKPPAQKPKEDNLDFDQIKVLP